MNDRMRLCQGRQVHANQGRTDMTRETKVGLIFGLGVILLVGVFISDYLNDLDGLKDESVPENFADFNHSTTNQSPALNVPTPQPSPAPLAAVEPLPVGRLRQADPPVLVSVEVAHRLRPGVGLAPAVSGQVGVH